MQFMQTLLHLESKVVFYWDQPFLVGWVGCFFFVFYWGKTVPVWFG